MSQIYISTRLGYPLRTEECAQKIYDAGFDGVLLWIGDKDSLSPQEIICTYLNKGLSVENLHAPVIGANEFWVRGSEGEETLNRFLMCINLCEQFHVGTVVIHMTRGICPINIDAEGRARLLSLIRYAEIKRVRLAFENVRQLGMMKDVLNEFQSSEFIGMCFDCGHDLCWNHGVDWLHEYRNRIFAVHLSDNDGNQDQHLMPFDGALDWTKMIHNISLTCYQDKIGLEVKNNTNSAYNDYTVEEFLSTAYSRAKALEELNNCNFYHSS